MTFLVRENVYPDVSETKGLPALISYRLLQNYKLLSKF